MRVLDLGNLKSKAPHHRVAWLLLLQISIIYGTQGNCALPLRAVAIRNSNAKKLI